MTKRSRIDKGLEEKVEKGHTGKRRKKERKSKTKKRETRRRKKERKKERGKETCVMRFFTQGQVTRQGSCLGEKWCLC